MIIPNYINFKAGLCSDMDFFKFSYAGKDGQVIKRYVSALGKTHPFYIIKRPLKLGTFEFKIYDFFHDGFIEKEIVVDDSDEPVPGIVAWWERSLRTQHIKEYILFCKETGRF